MMRKTPLWLLCLTLFPGSALAQRIQNSDVFWLFGASTVKQQTIDGSGATVKGATGLAIEYGYGYQIVRQSAASLWIEFAPQFGGADSVHTSLPSVVNLSWSAYPLGLRFMVPLAARVSVYAAGGGGAGSFHAVQFVPGTSPAVTSNAVWHGIFDFGGGVDIRLNRRLSIRAEVRDLVSGTGLSGAAGRNHLIPAGGLALHF